MKRWSLYGVFYQNAAGVPCWAMTRNRKSALRTAEARQGYVTRMNWPGCSVWDAPTFRVCSDLLADYR